MTIASIIVVRPSTRNSTGTCRPADVEPVVDDRRRLRARGRAAGRARRGTPAPIPIDDRDVRLPLEPPPAAGRDQRAEQREERHQPGVVDQESRHVAAPRLVGRVQHAIFGPGRRVHTPYKDQSRRTVQGCCGWGGSTPAGVRCGYVSGPAAASTGSASASSTIVRGDGRAARLADVLPERHVERRPAVVQDQDQRQGDRRLARRDGQDHDREDLARSSCRGSGRSRRASAPSPGASSRPTGTSRSGCAGRGSRASPGPSARRRPAGNSSAART